MMRLLQLYPNASSATNADCLQEAAQGAGCTRVWCKQVSPTQVEIPCSFLQLYISSLNPS